MCMCLCRNFGFYNNENTTNLLIGRWQRRDEDTEITLAKPIEEIVKLLPIVFDPNQHLLDNLQE